MQDLRLGIKSSYNKIRNTIALLYCIYLANGKKAICNYGETDGSIQKLNDSITQWIQNFIPTLNIEKDIKESKLITSQIEAIQVCLELVFALAKVSFNSKSTYLSERTGGNRYPKRLTFSSNIRILDSILSSYEENILKDFIKAWIANTPCPNNPLEKKVSEFLTLQSEKCVLKMRFKTSEDIFFQQEGIYEVLTNGASGVEVSDDEKVGTYRVLNSFINEGLHSFLINSNGEIKLRDGITIDELKVYLSEVSTSLDLSENRILINENEFSTIKYTIDDLNDEEDKTNISKFSSPQIIFYGAPGTGKSHKIKKHLKEKNVPAENIFRTTFHPDSDYSTFVGAFKPTMEKANEKFYSKNELISKLTKLKEKGITYVPQKFGAQYWKSLKQISPSDKKEILTECNYSENLAVEIEKGAAVGEEMLPQSKDSRIIYSFRPQAFLQAYIKAYQKPNENVYLIIEEINRGNCAQIFGDLFQLLDRDEDGKSEYSIKADIDLRNFLIEELGEDNEGIKGDELCLPSNLYIYATMNTSDQSLFPIDSAFKRRWDWEYEPIKYINKDWMIQIGDKKYSWVKFQKEVNSRISHDTGSEDKMMGDFFVNPHDKVISKELFLNKILFYLWNDVCKDGDTDIFPNDDFSFSNLYDDGNSEAIHKMMKHLEISPES